MVRKMTDQPEQLELPLVQPVVLGAADVVELTELGG